MRYQEPIRQPKSQEQKPRDCHNARRRLEQVHSTNQQAGTRTTASSSKRHMEGDAEVMGAFTGHRSSVFTGIGGPAPTNNCQCPTVIREGLYISSVPWSAPREVVATGQESGSRGAPNGTLLGLFIPGVDLFSSANSPVRGFLRQPKILFLPENSRFLDSRIRKQTKFAKL
jgi:hypothetical protein